MNLHPFGEVVENAERKIKSGWMIFQQFQCGGCKTKQTMEQPNSFFTSGLCEECGWTTDIVTDGCNFMAMISPKSGEVGERIKEVGGVE